jgi:anaerobic magnesium-protoporphyrin IX monomethyl ester cyclase
VLAPDCTRSHARTGAAGSGAAKMALPHAHFPGDHPRHERLHAERDGWAAADVTVVEFPPGSPAAEVAAALLANDPAIIGLSCYIWNIFAMREVCRIVRAARPGVTIVLGGPEVGPVGDDVLASLPADVVVKSEGEVAMGLIAAAVRSRTSLTAIPGLWVRGGDRITDTGEAPILGDLNTLPSPHQDAFAPPGRRIVSIETQRGCVFRCNFCFYNKDLSIRNRRFDLDRVKREILFWLDRGAPQIYLMDPVFNLKAERAKEICRFIAAHNAGGVLFRAEVWAEFIDEELASLMRAANLRYVEVGLQTTNDTALAAVERRLRMEPFLAGLRHLKAHGVEYELQLIYGLPGETAASFRQSLDFSARLDPDALAVFPLMILPGTELWRKAASMGLAYDPNPPYLVRSHADMSEAEMDAGLKMVEAIEVMGDARAVRLLCREEGVEMSDVVDAWIAHEAVTESPAARARAAIRDVCESRGISPAFYDAIAAREFAG